MNIIFEFMFLMMKEHGLLENLDVSSTTINDANSRFKQTQGQLSCQERQERFEGRAR